MSKADWGTAHEVAGHPGYRVDVINFYDSTEPERAEITAPDGRLIAVLKPVPRENGANPWFPAPGYGVLGDSALWTRPEPSGLGDAVRRVIRLYEEAAPKLQELIRLLDAMPSAQRAAWLRLLDAGWKGFGSADIQARRGSTLAYAIEMYVARDEPGGGSYPVGPVEWDPSTSL